MNKILRDKDGNIRTCIDILWVSFVSVVVICVAVVSIFILLHLYIYTRYSYVAKGFIIGVLRHSGDPVLLFIACISEIISIVFIISVWKFYNKGSLIELGLSKKKMLPRIATGLLLGVFSITLIYSILLFTGAVNVDAVNYNYVFSRGFRMYAFIFTVVAAYEEVLFRAYWMSVLRRTKNLYIVILGSAFLFSLIHVFNNGSNVLGIFNLFLLGVLFALMLYKTGSIFMSTGYLIVWNFFEGCVFGIPISGTASVGIITSSMNPLANSLLTGKNFGAEGSIITTFVFIVEILIFYFLVDFEKDQYDWNINTISN